MKTTPWIYTSRLQKGGALIEDMRSLVRSWRDAPREELREDILRSNLLNKQTRSRLADIYRRSFVPRFLEGPIPDAWRFARPLEDAGASVHVVRPVYYWITAIGEPLIRDFCREYLMSRQAIARTGVGIEEVANWLGERGCPWSPVVTKKVARGLLAALRDFGVLEGRTSKKLASFVLPIPAFAYLARCFRETGAVSRSLLNHPDWQLFLLSTGDVEHLFLRAHQESLLEYHTAGSALSISFPPIPWRNMPVLSLKDRFDLLEADLMADPPRFIMSRNLPFAIFRYDPSSHEEQEWRVRKETELLGTRVGNLRGRRVEHISLAELFWQSIQESEGMDALLELEKEHGFNAAEKQVNRYLSDRDFRPLCELLLQKAHKLPADTRRSSA